MAEAAVVSVLGKLAVVIAKEAQFLGGVKKKVERVQRELIRMKCCLIDADSKHKGDERVRNWLNELRDLACRIEDATDTFFLKVEGHRREDANIFQNLIKKVCNKPKQLYFRHKLGNELDDIQNLLEEISKSRVTYGIRDLPLEDKNNREAVKMPLRRPTYSEVNENEVVGLQADKENILKLLRPEKTSRRAVISIVGAGGLGKTTLACMVYKSAKADFSYHIMLSISQQYSLTGLLRKMISNSVPNDRDEDYYVGELKRCLNGRRYLIILDDVWTGDLWNELKEILPDQKNGSRVLMTTRLTEVAKSADSEIPPYELKFLNERESLDLLLKKVFPYKKPNEECCPKDLLHLAPKLSNKCKGLPLALIVLGGILAAKELAYPAWERVLQTMNWYSDGISCMQILAMSYDDMPYYLKACFQYLACFPEDNEISAKRLIRMWIAEGFIPLEGTTMEILAEECLEELAQRSMVQVLCRSSNGLIKSFKVHDILRELAMDEAMHENFVTIFSYASNDTKPNRIIRRASLQAEEKNSQFIKYVGRNTRSLLLFGRPEYYKTGLHWSNFRLLKVLEIDGWNGKLVLKSLDELIHLKYLGMRDCDIDLSSCSLHRMRGLETLDMRGSWGKQPCDDLWSIGTLRHVQCNYEYMFGRPLPKCIDLNHLQTLKWVIVEGACDWKLPNLRKLGILNLSDEWVSITNLLQTLPLLVSLGISSDGYLPMAIVYPKALSNYQNLQLLYLIGKWPENVNVEARLFPPHLVKLVLHHSDLEENPMQELGKLNNLKKLCLGYKAFSEDWKGPIIFSEGFPALQHLKVFAQYSTIMDLTVEQGVMPKLTYLEVDEGIEVHLPPELQHVIRS